MGGAGGGRGVWGYVEGGMGALSDALRRGADAAGVTVRVDAPVAQIETVGGRAVAVRLVSGERITARQIVSNATPAVTFLQLLDTAALPANFRSPHTRLDFSSALMKTQPQQQKTARQGKG